MENYKKSLSTKSNPNVHKNAPNCPILKTFPGEGGGYAPEPPSKSAWFRHAQYRVCYINSLGEPCMAHLNFLREPFGSPFNIYLYLMVILMQI